MKKILTLVAVLAFGFANAQEVIVVEKKDKDVIGFSKGEMWVEGGFSFRSSDSETPGALTSSFAFTPKVGYMINDNLGLGGFLNFSGGATNSMGGTNYSDNKFGTFGIGAFARYYFLSLGASKSFQAYGEFGLGYSSVTSKPGNYNPNPGGGQLPKTTDSELNANLAIGMNYFFTSNWAATFTLANILSYNSANPENGNNTSNLEINVNLFNNIFAQPQFGLLYKW